ncbi:MAG: NADH-quinone oxidoreductase subunit J [Ignavibacteriales bacterium]|nr:NADH-quinone oxidoreductase subunit J [Ignavibacteriales bacterium]
MSIEAILFYLIAISAITSALLMVLQKNPVKSVLFMIVNFFCLAVIYLLLHAQFIAIVQILVYAGAIMVLFLFVIMLLNLGNESLLKEKYNYKRTIAYILSGIILLELIIGISIPLNNSPAQISADAVKFGSVESIGAELFQNYLLPFEAVSVLLLAAIVGVVVLAKKRK